MPPREPLPHERLTLDAGVGVLGYWSGGAPGTSGAWDVRAGYMIVPVFTVEAGYTGAAGDAVGPGGVVATIVEGDARLNPLGASRFSPYLFAGAGWGAFSGFGGFKGDNSTVTVPLGLGADYLISPRFTTGARFTYRFVAADNVGPTGASVDNWQLIGRVGTRF
jgi:hypothetical protein